MASLQQEYREGRLAHASGKRRKDNPYKPFSKQWDSWDHGWEDGVWLRRNR